MKKTLVVLAHPDMENSRANKAFKEEAEKLREENEDLRVWGLLQENMLSVIYIL